MEKSSRERSSGASRCPIKKHMSDTTEALVPVYVFIYRLRYRSGTVNALRGGGCQRRTTRTMRSHRRRRRGAGCSIAVDAGGQAGAFPTRLEFRGDYVRVGLKRM